MNGPEYLQAAGGIEGAEGLDPWTALMRVLVARLQGVELPAPLQPALARAGLHWSGHPVDLIEEKIRVWQYIEAMPPPDADLATREGRAARALLCVLEPAGDDEARSMTAEWFAAMVDAQPSGG